MKGNYKKAKSSIMNWRKNNVAKYNEYMRLYNLKTRWNKICSDYEHIENYELAKEENFHSWVIHHKLGLNLKRSELIKRNMYYDRPADELIFMRKSDHSRLHILEKIEKNSREVKKMLIY